MPRSPTECLAACIANLEMARSIAVKNSKKIKHSVPLEFMAEAYAYAQAIQLLRTEFSDYLPATSAEQKETSMDPTSIWQQASDHNVWKQLDKGAQK